MKDDFPARAIVPGLHALIVGVSEYPHLLNRDLGEPTPKHHLGLYKLRSAATAAYQIYRFVVERADRLGVPLATCRLLLSPSPQEAARLPDIALPATLDNFETAAAAWRESARSHAGNMTLFYFAGHGLIRTGNGGQVLLFQDFAANKEKILRRCLEASNLVDGMASTSAQDTMARRQLYFFDACRSLPNEVQKYDRMDAETIWDLPDPDPNVQYIDDRLVSMFYTEQGGSAFGIENMGSIFGEALLRCLKGGAGIFDQRTGRWSVTVSSLRDAILKQLAIVNREYGTAQTCRTNAIGDDKPLHQLDGPPAVEVEITLEPPEKRAHGKIAVFDARKNPVFDLDTPTLDHYRKAVAAGQYEAESVPPGIPPRWLVPAEPPFSTWLFNLE
jgi:hypothetical protein